jgi:hypothetical protein
MVVNSVSGRERTHDEHRDLLAFELHDRHPLPLDMEVLGARAR